MIYLYIFIALTVVLLAIELYRSNKIIYRKRYQVRSYKVPPAFEGFKIAQVSDFHNEDWGGKLEAILEDEKPNVIFITGDLLDSRRTDLERAKKFLSNIRWIAPVYYVTGNHESRRAEFKPLKDHALKIGINFMDDRSALIERGGKIINILGLQDPDFEFKGIKFDRVKYVTDRIGKMNFNKEAFTILLSHRPELFKGYVASGVDLAFSGHAHGGQVRLPLIGGLFAPHQLFFPRYSKGMYSESATTMIVSAGVGKSEFPVRANNPFELVLVELRTTDTK